MVPRYLFVLPVALTWTLLALVSQAVGGEDSVPINKILADPEEYHLQTVYLQGMVEQVTAMEPYHLPSGAGCYGAYTFLLADTTGTLPVAVLGICGSPLLLPPPLTEGDRVVVQAHIRAPGHGGTLQGVIGVPLPEGPSTTVQAIANQIRRAEE